MGLVDGGKRVEADAQVRRSATRRHRLLEHTGEIELQVEAPDLAGLFAEAAVALAEIMAEDAGRTPTRPPERVELLAADREALLVDWLNELLYRGEVNKCVYGHVEVERADDARLVANLRGHEPLSPRTAVKAATWHRLRVVPTPLGFEATVVLDV
jgi:SHS2 domain-containing protein